jgi:hypothetical protein
MKTESINVAHGGHSGDITYSLPLVKYLSGKFNKKVIFHVISDRAVHFPSGMKHPNGNSTIMTQQAYNFIRPLLASLPYVGDVLFTNHQDIPNGTIFLDYYRDIPGLNQGAGNIQTWARKWLGVPLNSDNPWIKIKKDQSTPKIICAFTQRYRNTAINYHFLEDFDAGFIGLDSEFDHFKEKNNLKNIKRIHVKDALEMATQIGSARFYFGNQSFGFAMAEGIKVKRALEVCEICPNVIPSGNGAHEYLTHDALCNILADNKMITSKIKRESKGSYTHYWD